ncbi:hypothetical protein FRB95_002448 [Tulasnella sp. JGI-2019a]|nr:hypothetical protein FRB95_002448 [Tulasnella sp. JGI-2019a]
MSPSAASTSTSCSTTPAGNYDSGTGNTQPNPCPLGYTTPSTGSTNANKCTMCSAGTKAVTDNTGSVTCSACPQGSLHDSVLSTATDFELLYRIVEFGWPDDLHSMPVWFHFSSQCYFELSMHGMCTRK